MGDLSNNNVDTHRALEIEVVLEQIFKFCSVKDLISCRQVSTLWKIASNRKWRSSAAVKLDGRDKISEFVSFWLGTYAKHSFGSFHLHGFTTALYDQPFWNACGENITSLELSRYKFQNIHSFRAVMYGSVPNMETLVFRNVVIGSLPTANEQEHTHKGYFDNGVCIDKGYGENWTLKSLTLDQVTSGEVYWKEFLQHFPGISAIHLQGVVDRLDDFLDALKQIRQENPKMVRLQKLNILREHRSLNKRIHSGLLKVLTDGTISLESLSLSLAGNDPEYVLTSILRSQGQSLRKLELYRNPRKPTFLDAFPIFLDLAEPQLFNLTELVLHSRAFNSLEFLKFTPNLVKLRILDISTKNKESSIVAQTDMGDMKNVQLSHCMELEYSRAIPAEDLNKLIEILPHVERLKMTLNNETFSVVCDRWRNLISLELTTASSVDECGITGMTPEDVAKINDGYQDEPLNMVKPNIASLQYLRRLYLTSTPVSTKTLGYCGARFGIEKLPNLINLKICRSGFAVMSCNQIWRDLQARCPWN